MSMAPLPTARPLQTSLSAIAPSTLQWRLFSRLLGVAVQTSDLEVHARLPRSAHCLRPSPVLTLWTKNQGVIFLLGVASHAGWSWERSIHCVTPQPFPVSHSFPVAYTIPLPAFLAL